MIVLKISYIEFIKVLGTHKRNELLYSKRGEKVEKSCEVLSLVRFFLVRLAMGAAGWRFGCR